MRNSVGCITLNPMKMPMISLRLPRGEIELLDNISEVKDTTRSELLRLYIVEGIARSVEELPDE